MIETSKMIKTSARKTAETLKNLSPDLKIIAVTGKMASGKNYISSLLEKEGWKCIDADLLVHKAIDESTDRIYQTFKEEAEKQKLNILTADRKINRRELGRLLFSAPELLQKQEEIVYPVITEMIKDFINQNEKSLINATVLYKTPELLQLCQAVLYVQSSFIKRFCRCRKRDRLPARQIFKRFHAQRNLLDEYKKSGRPIIIIKN